MKLKLDGSLGILLMMVMEFLKLDLPAEEPEADGPVLVVPVVGEDPAPPSPTPAQADIIEQIIDHTYPSPVVIFDDTEQEELLRREHVDTTTTIAPAATIDRTIHRTIE